MGAVYLAEDLNLKRKVALKVLPDDLASDEERLQRFRREAETLAALDHPNIVTIHSIEEADGVRFFTMQYVEGEELGERTVSGGMPLSEFFEIAVPLADSLAAAHDRGVTSESLQTSSLVNISLYHLTVHNPKRIYLL